MCMFSSPLKRRMQLRSPLVQRGDVLLEALFGVLITGIIGAGMMHLESFAMKRQHEAKMERMVIQQLRDQIETQGDNLCSLTGSSADAGGSLVLNLTPKLSVNGTIHCDAQLTESVNFLDTTLPVAVPQRINLNVPMDQLTLGIPDSTKNPQLTLSSGQ